MTFTYDPTRLDINRNKLRLMLGPDGTTNPTFQDEELDYIIDKNNEDLNWALYDCYNICSVKYGITLGDSLKIGDITITDGKNKANYYRDLAIKLKEDILAGEYYEFSPDVVLGGIYKYDVVLTDKMQAYGNLYPSFNNPILYKNDNTTDNIGKNK